MERSVPALPGLARVSGVGTARHAKFIYSGLQRWNAVLLAQSARRQPRILPPADGHVLAQRLNLEHEVRQPLGPGGCRRMRARRCRSSGRRLCGRGGEGATEAQSVLCSPEDGGVLSVCGLCVAPVRPPLSVSLAARCPIVMHLAECHVSLSRPTRRPSTPPSWERAVSPPLLVNAVLLAQSARRQRVSASCSRASAWMPRDSSARRRRVNSAR